MSKTPIRVDSRAWTGDQSVAPREFEMLGRRFDAREKRKLGSVRALIALIFGALICLAIDLMIWFIDGSPAYLAPRSPNRHFLIALATSAGALLLLLRLSNSWRLWPLAIVTAMLGGELAISFRYLQDSGTSGPIQMVTFAIEGVKLQNRGRGSNSAKLRPEARLIDGGGRLWTLKGRREFIAPLVGHDCMTFSLRGSNGGYQFVESVPTLIETPYIDSIRGQRHLARCFTRSGQAS